MVLFWRQSLSNSQASWLRFLSKATALLLPFLFQVVACCLPSLCHASYLASQAFKSKTSALDREIHTSTNSACKAGGRLGTYKWQSQGAVCWRQVREWITLRCYGKGQPFSLASECTGATWASKVSLEGSAQKKLTLPYKNRVRETPFHFPCVNLASSVSWEYKCPSARSGIQN